GVLGGGRGEWGRGDRGDGGRLGGHRGRPPALGRVPVADDRGGSHAQRRRDNHPDPDRHPVCGAGRTNDHDSPDAGSSLAAYRRGRIAGAPWAATPRAGCPGRGAVMVADAVGGILLTGIPLYAVLGGADFGAGLWDRLAGTTRQGRARRALIDESITPVWEANHVWLVFILVVFWTAFPDAFAAVMNTAAVPLWLAVGGIVLRGSGFAFRKEISQLSWQRAAGATFAFSSLVTPFFMGTVIGAIATGSVPADATHASLSAWTSATSILIGFLFVAACGYLAAVYLVGEATSRNESQLEMYFTRRAQVAAVVAGALSLGTLAELHSSNRALYDKLTGRALPLVILAGVCG